jgi:hypothetical protein
MPASRLVALILGLDDHWGPHEENTARLLEAQSYALEFAYADRTIDPEDPAVKAERARNKKRKPPPHPIVPPVAFRPKRYADERMAEYVEQIGKYLPKQEPVDPFEQLALWKSQRGLVSK